MGEMKVFAVLDESTYVFGKAVESQEGNGEGHVGARWRKIAIAHGFVNNNYLQGFGAPWFFQVGGPRGEWHLEISVAAAAQLFGSSEGVGCVFSVVH